MAHETERPDDVEANRERMPWWPIGLSVALLASLLIGMLVILPLYGRPSYKVGMYDATTSPVTSVHYINQTWVPDGKAVALNDLDMVAVAQANEGPYLYVEASRDLTGGGGGKPEVGADVATYQQIYLRTHEGLYQPLRRVQGHAP